MRIKHIIKLATEAAKGKDNFKLGTVGSNGYGFVFRDFDSHITPYGSHKFCSAGAYRDYTEKLNKNLFKFNEFEGFTGLLRYPPKLDLLFIGSLKTLVPSLQFGSQIELFFRVWMLALTPEGQLFPATFYWGKSGLSIGAWSRMSFKIEGALPKEFLKLNAFSPFQFTKNETGLFLDAFEFALKKVPISDFWGVYTYALGNLYMGVKRGKPFIEHMKHCKRDPKAENEIKPLIGKDFKGRYGKSFSIKILQSSKYYRIYILQSKNEWDPFFGSARDVLEYYYELTSSPIS